ncbi:LysR family transcriptional regulator [Desulfitobacterium sp. THU1]|uniref:LysR family transcriptional regulator n=1 Tax=Desulfitobacterium sp. THU1 TaxID=3138072 RepID=UPI00311FE7A3
MRFEDLNYFIDLSETHSIHRTAEHFFISPQGISKSMKSIEKELGVILLNRSNTGISLTPDGEYFLDIAKSITETYKKAIDHFLSTIKYSPVLNGKLDIICTPRILDTFLYRIIKDYEKSYSQVSLSLKTLNSLEALEEVSSNQADIGIISVDAKYYEASFSQLLSKKGLQFKVLSLEKLFICSNKNTPWAKTSVISEDKLYKIPKIVLKYNFFTPEDFKAFKSNNLIYEVNSMDACRKMTEDKLGITFITKREFDQFFSKGKSFILLEQDNPTDYYFGYVIPENVEISPQLNKFIESLKKYFQIIPT